MTSLTPLRTVEEVAERLGVDRDAVTAFIKSKELPAINVNRDRNSKRATWRIKQEDLDQFELNRRTLKPLPKKKISKLPPARSWV